MTNEKLPPRFRHLHFLFSRQIQFEPKSRSRWNRKLYASEITLLELTYGAYNSTDFAKHINEVYELEEIFNILPIRTIKEVYGQERKRLRSIGQLIPNFDLLIGCTAKHHNMTMVTNNEAHLSRIDGIVIENWTKKKDNEFI